MPPLETDIEIETPEHIVFHHRVAGPARRALGHVLDLAICYGAVGGIALLVALASRGAARELGGAGRAAVGVLLLALFATQWVYFVVWEGLSGRSPGKMAVGVRVVTTSGQPIGWGQAALRNLLRAADLLPVGYVAGVVSMALSSRFQRLGDLVAGTMVIVPDRAQAAEPLVLAPPASPAELARLPEELSLDPEERAAIELFLRRRRTLGPAREHELASIVAEPLADRLLGLVPERLRPLPDPARFLALVHHRAVNEGRSQAPPSLHPTRPARRGS
jgi:uncharacterized RDD family membrane protein YckC